MMKKLSMMLAILALGALIAIGAGKATIKFAETSHDFGNINANGGSVSHDYKFTNTGDAPLIVISVSNGGCGCTTPSFTKQPIPPGHSGVIKITFNPRGRSGEFNRKVTVKTNASNKKTELKFSGHVIPQ